MRTTLNTMLLAGLLATPVMAQDTTIVIKNDDCSVKVDGKRLTTKDEKAACDRIRLSADKMRDQMGVLRERLLDQSEAFRVQGQALRDQDGAVARLRSSDFPEMAALLKDQQGNLLRLQDESGKFGELTFNMRPLAALAARPRFGITIDTRARDTDRYGAYVSAVTPGGPADKAGIQSADLIVKIGTEVVAQTKAEETPGVRLIALIGNLEVGKAVDVELRRVKDTKKVKVTPENDDNFFAGTLSPGEDPSTMFRLQYPPSGGSQSTEALSLDRARELSTRWVDGVMARDPTNNGSYSFSLRGGAGGQLGEMAAMNSELGDYFGTTDGVLILNPAKIAGLSLKAGDVVLSVDGRNVSTPMALTRILRSYEKGDAFKLQIMRQKKSQTLTGEMR